MNWFPFAMAMMIMVLMMLWMMRSNGWFDNVGMSGDWDDDVREIVIEEYYADNLKVRVFYNSEYMNSRADTDEYTETGEVKLTVYVDTAPKSEIEEKTSGCWLDMGPAIVRVIADTRQVVSVTYIKE